MQIKYFSVVESEYFIKNHKNSSMQKNDEDTRKISTEYTKKKNFPNKQFENYKSCLQRKNNYFESKSFEISSKKLPFKGLAFKNFIRINNNTEKNFQVEKNTEEGNKIQQIQSLEIFELNLFDKDA